jgi:putative NADH-flavin reductase
MATSATNSMRLFVLGATGGTGRALTDQALDRGHRVTAFVRSPHKLAARPGLALFKGDPRDGAALSAALAGHDAVLSSLGPPGPAATTIVSEAARTTVSAMNTAGVRRLLIVGVAILFDDVGILGSILRRTLLRNIAKDSSEMEGIVKASGLDWTIARPPRLTNGPLTGRYGVADDQLPRGVGGAPSISRADVAHFLLEELEHPAHIRRIVGLAYTKDSARLASNQVGAPL